MTNRSFWRTALSVFTLTALLVTLFACATPRVHDDLEYGKALMAAGRPREAVSVLQRAQNANPNDTDTVAALKAARAQLALLEQAQQPEGAGAAVASSSAAQIVNPVPRAEIAAVSASSAVASERTFVAANVASSVTSSAARSVARAATSSSSLRSVASSAASSATTPIAAAAGEPSMEEALNKKVTLQFRDAPVRSLFDAIGKSSGLNIVIDKDVQQDLRTSIYLKEVSIRTALEKIALTTRLGWQTMENNTLLIYPDEPAKQADYQNLVVRGFHVSNADVKLVANSLKTVLKFKDLVVDEKLNMIVVRDTPKALALAEQLIALHDVPEPEVMLEVAILEVSSGKLQSLGVAWPTSLSLTPLSRFSTATTTTTSSGSSSSESTTTTSIPLTLRDLNNLTPGRLGLTLGSDLTINANATDSDVNMLANPRIRAKNREKAKILIGERVPNISATATSNGVVSQNITYVDVGLKLDVEPQIFPGNEIGLKIALEVSSINSVVENKSNGTVAYRIGTRNASTVLRLKDGENQVLAGLIQDNDRKTVSKVPLLGDIPILGRLFRSDSTDKGKTEVVLSITPRLVRGSAKPDAAGESFDAGTQTSVRGRRNDFESPDQSVINSSQPTPQPNNGGNTNNGQQGDQPPRRSRDD